LLDIPDVAVLATLKWVSVGNWVASWWAFNGVFRLTFSSFKIQKSFVRAANVGSRDKVLTLWARILSISALILLNIPDFTVLAALKWVSVGNGVASGWAFNRVFRLAFSRFEIQESLVRTADVCSRNQVLAVGAWILSISTLIKLNVPDLAVLAALLWVSVRDRISSGWAFNRVFRLALSGLEIVNSVVGAADVRIRNEVLSLGARILALSRVRIKDGFEWTASECSIVKRDQVSSFWTRWRINALLFLRVPVFAVLAAHWRAGSSDVPRSRRTMFSGLVTDFEFWIPYKSFWTAFEWIDRNLESSFGTDTLSDRRCSWYKNRLFWTACEHRYSSHGIVPAFFALASSCFGIEDLTLQWTILGLSRAARISQIWIRLRSVWTSARISFFSISDGSWRAANAVR